MKVEDLKVGEMYRFPIQGIIVIESLHERDDDGRIGIYTRARNLKQEYVLYDHQLSRFKQIDDSDIVAMILNDMSNFDFPEDITVSILTDSIYIGNTDSHEGLILSRGNIKRLMNLLRREINNELL